MATPNPFDTETATETTPADSSTETKSTENTASETNEAQARDDDGRQQRPRRRRLPISRANIPIQIELKSRQAQKVYDMHYRRTRNSLYVISVILPMFVDPKDAEQVSSVIEAEFEKAQTEMADAIARMEVLVTENGIDASAVEYSQPLELTARINSPKSGQYLALIRKLDEFASLMSVLWLSGIHTDNQYTIGNYQYERRMSKLSNRIYNLSRRAMSLMRRADSRDGALDPLLEDIHIDEDAEAATDDSDNPESGSSPSD